MFRSSLTDWCISSTPFSVIPLKETGGGCKKRASSCVFITDMDWHHPDWGTRAPGMTKHRHAGHGPLRRFMKGQLKGAADRLPARSGFSGSTANGKNLDPRAGRDLYNYVRGLQRRPSSTTVSAKGRAAWKDDDQGKERIGRLRTPSSKSPQPFRPWCGLGIVHDDEHHWGYNKKRPEWKSTTTLIRNLVTAPERPAIISLERRPTSEGLIPEAGRAVGRNGEW